MKNLFTFAAASALAAASFTAQAQIVLDGRLTASEITAGNYRLLGKFTNPRGFGDAGLLSLYAGSNATKMFFFVGGTVETNGNAFQLYLDLPNAPGVPVGTPLTGASAGTSFQNVTAKMDLAVDVALALRSDGMAFKIEGATYTATTAASMDLTTATAQLAGTGTPAALSATATATPGYTSFAGTRVAYRNAGTGSIAANPGNTVPNTGVSYGGVGSYGWEIEINRVAAGITAGSQVGVFILQNGGDGGYMSSDFIPQTSAPLTTNNGNLATGAFDFTTLPDLQAAFVVPGATGLNAKAEAEAAVAMSIAPNPSLGQATVSYRVLDRAAAVRVTLTDLMGRTVKTTDAGIQAPGIQQFELNSTGIAAGTYLVKVQVGDKASTRKVVLL